MPLWVTKSLTTCDGQSMGGSELQSSAIAADDVVGDEEIKAIDAGFDYIEKCWNERTVPANGMRQLQWILRELKMTTGPLYHNGAFKWTQVLIQTAFRKLQEQGCLAKTWTDCPYTLQTLSPWFVDNIIVHLVPYLTKHSLGVVGVAGSGKTPLLESAACCFSRFWKRKLKIGGTACFRSAADLDFFRGEEGTIDRPDQLDDVDPKTITPSKWKAFTDAGLAKAMTRERWGASKWKKKQLRLWAVNPIDESNEPANKLHCGIESGRPDEDTIKHASFLEIIEPIFTTGMDYESKLALLKRSALIVITSNNIYWRVPSEQPLDVRRLPRRDESNQVRPIISLSAYDMISTWKGDDKVEYPEDYEDQLAFEERWMNAVMSRGALPVPRLTPERCTNVVVAGDTAQRAMHIMDSDEDEPAPGAAGSTDKVASAPACKGEVHEDNAFRDLVDHLATTTCANPLHISDSDE